MATLIIVNGPSASGKSTLSQRLAKDLGLPLVSRDVIKEALFDSLGYSDRQQSKTFGSAAALVLLRQVDILLRSGVSCIIEGKFNPKFSQDEIAALARDNNASVIQVQCRGKGQELLVRFHRRARSERHPGHAETDNLDDFTEELLAGVYPILDLPGEFLEYDSTQPNDRYDKLLADIRSGLN